MKNLKLFALVTVFLIILVSCSSTEEKTAQAQSSEQAIALNDETKEAVEEAVIQEEEMKIEEEAIAQEQQQTEEAEEEGEVKPQAPKVTPKTTDKAKAKPSTSTKTEAAKPAAKPAAETTSKTTEKSVTETINKKIKQPELKKTVAPEVKKTSDKPSHSAFNTLLNKYVTSSGTVNYAGFKSQKSTLDNYLNDLAENPVQSSWSKNEKMAYWINLYNAATIKLILDNYPTSSIKNINGGKPWDKRWIKSGSKTYTLNEIENSILRPQFNDPRIHFAVNCAAQSCPRLMNKAFTASNLNSLMDENARWFINNSTFNSLSAKKVEISKIFDWYKDDFGNIINYLNKYATTEINSNAKVSYKEYNWKLNGK